jgi:predicted amidophosphoribosyltransferase
MAVKFYCENCKYEVPLNDERCPFCGKEFFSVYCPRCKREGLPVEFRNGCPRCGYMKEGVKAYRKPRGERSKGKKFYLPRWCYSGAIILLLLAIIGLVAFVFLRGKL